MLEHYVMTDSTDNLIEMTDRRRRRRRPKVVPRAAADFVQKLKRRGVLQTID